MWYNTWKQTISTEDEQIQAKFTVKVEEEIKLFMGRNNANSSKFFIGMINAAHSIGESK